jgi:hypothetical protein
MQKSREAVLVLDESISVVTNRVSTTEAGVARTANARELQTNAEFLDRPGDGVAKWCTVADTGLYPLAKV